MMRIDGFGRSAAFAAVAALGWFPWAAIAGPVAGMPAARTLYLVVVTALYAGGLARDTPRRALVGAGVAAAGAVVAVAARGLPELCIGLAAVLGFTRSGLLRRGEPARAIVLEGALLVGGLVFARFLAGGRLGTAPPLWGFLLVQSCFFLAAGVRPWAAAGGRRADPFEEARARALEVLDRAT
jgi:hypothetical protein